MDQNPGRSGSRTATSLPSLKVRGVNPNLVGWDDGIFPKFFEGAKVTPPFGSRNLQFSFKILKLIIIKLIFFCFTLPLFGFGDDKCMIEQTY